MLNNSYFTNYFVKIISAVDAKIASACFQPSSIAYLSYYNNIHMII